MTKYDKSVRDNIFTMYSAGVPIERVAKKMGIAKVTIYNWIKKYNWGSRNEEIRKKSLEQANETITEIKLRQHKILKGMIGEYIKQLKESNIDIKTSDMINILKHELLLFGEAEHKTETSTTLSEIYKEWEKNKASVSNGSDLSQENTKQNLLKERTEKKE